MKETDLKFPSNIAAERHEISKKWVLHYLTDEQAEICHRALLPITEHEEWKNNMVRSK